MCRITSQKKSGDIKRRGGGIFAAGLALICLIGTLLTPMAYASTNSSQVITVVQHFTSAGASSAPDEMFTYSLSPKTPNALKAIGSDTYTFMITGANEMHLDVLNFTTAGRYVYELRCVTEDRSNYTIDRRVYTIEIYVSDSSLTATMVVYTDDRIKASDISFEHTYTAPPIIPESENITHPPVVWLPPNSGVGVPGGSVTTINEGANTPGTEFSVPGTEFSEPDIVIDIPSRIPDAPAPSISRPHTPTNAPKTGDFSNPELWTRLIVISGTLLVLVIWVGWKSSRSSKNTEEMVTDE
ncbi:MAG: hypothetical protein FWC75_00215 [Oscillospiraceae bacterium]|nr:hypothetical protein [Oscillospiraceae bacterium]